MDILLSEDTHDIVFVNGVTPITADVGDSLKQRLKIKLLTFKGEWFLDTNYGTPYFQQIFGKGRSKGSVDLIFRELIDGDADVKNILKFKSSLSADRGYTLSFTVSSKSGGTAEIQNLEVGI
jgi:hypothetical protein